MMSCAQFFALVMGATCLKAKDLSVPHGCGHAALFPLPKGGHAACGCAWLPASPEPR